MNARKPVPSPRPVPRRRASSVVRAALAALGVLAPLCAVALVAPARAEEPKRPLLGLTFDRYHDGAAIRSALETIHAAYPEWTRLESMGNSREGRPLWVISVFDPSGRPVADRPAMYIDGNTHGNEVQGGEVCLFTAKYLLERKDEDPWVAALLRRVVFHLAPCVNPDSRERFLHEANDDHSPRRVPRPVDDDKDGLVDEDGPNDVDGDGEILLMRVEDRNGDLVPDERDDRLMRRVKPGERGRYRLLGPEGLDDDGDGRVNEDPIGGVDPNRNWPCDWRPEPQQGGAGPFPLSEPETRATALWILAHPRIAAVQSYHNAGMMILRPPGSRTDKEAEVAPEDKVLYDELGKRGMVLLPGYRYMQIREELYQVWGGFLEWTAHARGIVSFTNEVWGLFGWGTSVVDGDLRALQWNDVALHGEGFVRWKKFQHPTLGPVELGGWKRYTIRSTPVDFLPDLCMRNCLFTLEHASTVPDLAVRVDAVADGGSRLTVTVENRALLPTVTAWARRFHELPPDEISVEGAKVLAAVEVARAGEVAEAIPVKEGRARLESGIRGTSTRTFTLYLDSPRPAPVVTLSSRLGGVVAGRPAADGK